MASIYHITNEEHWRQAQEKGLYDFCSLNTEGFIHCSTADQFVEVANRIFRDRTDLLLLEIDPEKVTDEIRHENLEGGEEMYPHIYGPIPLDAVISVHDFPANANGGFDSPLNG